MAIGAVRGCGACEDVLAAFRASRSSFPFGLRGCGACEEVLAALEAFWEPACESDVVGSTVCASAAFATVAPIRLSGSAIRPIGRLRSDSSPSKIAFIGCAAQTPASNRIDVPELPRYKGPDGSRSFPPVTRTSASGDPRSSGRLMSAPIADSAAAVCFTSSPSDMPNICDSPSARADKMSAL